MKGPGKLSILVHAGGYDRVHYALVMASAAAATNRRVTLFFTGRAVTALLAGAGSDTPAWHRLDPADDGVLPAEREAILARRGVGTFEELLLASVELGVRFMVCEMALRALGLENPPLRPDVPIDVGGVVTFLNDAETDGAMLFV